MILGIYHPPVSTQQKNSNSNFIDGLTELITTTGSENRDIMLLGDLSLHIDDLEDPDTDQIITTMEAFGLKQHITFPNSSTWPCLGSYSNRINNSTNMCTNTRTIPLRS